MEELARKRERRRERGGEGREGARRGAGGAEFDLSSRSCPWAGIGGPHHNFRNPTALGRGGRGWMGVSDTRRWGTERENSGPSALLRGPELCSAVQTAPKALVWPAHAPLSCSGSLSLARMM